MRLKITQNIFVLIFVLCCCMLQLQVAASYRTEVEITPAPPAHDEEPTTKKSGFFGGIKSFFRGSATTTTPSPLTVEVNQPAKTAIAVSTSTTPATPQSNLGKNSGIAQKQTPPPPLVIQPAAPLMPLGPRPDTPPSSPLAGSSQQPPQWPQVATASSTTTVAPQQQAAAARPQQPSPGAAGATNRQQPNLPPGFAPYHPPKQQPSGLDLSYGGGGSKNAPNGERRPAFGLAPLSSSTSTTTTTTTTSTTPKSNVALPAQDSMNIDLRGGFNGKSTTTTTTTQRPQQFKENFPALPQPRRPSSSDIKEDFPALPAPKSPSSIPARTSSTTPSSVWQQHSSSTVSPQQPNSKQTPDGGNRVAFVPRSGTTTVRPGFASTGNSVATDDEILALTETLYTKEVNSQLNLIRVSPQGKTRSIDSTDAAPEPLLQVEEKALESPTIAKMRLLFNNYEVDTMVNEYVTPNEHKEENDFLDAIMATSVMRQTMQFLQNKGLIKADPKTHRDLVKELWFTQYSRGSGKIGSSGFEHVFVNEVKNGTLIGLHNWVYFYDEEKSGRLDYKGYMSQLDLGTKGKVLKVRFSHNGLNKPVNTLFVGTSPELELALYTLCFELRPDRTCPVSLGNSKFGIVTYSWRYRGKNLIGSAYPEI